MGQISPITHQSSMQLNKPQTTTLFIDYIIINSCIALTATATAAAPPTNDHAEEGDHNGNGCALLLPAYCVMGICCWTCNFNRM